MAVLSLPKKETSLTPDMYSSSLFVCMFMCVAPPPSGQGGFSTLALEQQGKTMNVLLRAHFLVAKVCGNFKITLDK